MALYKVVWKGPVHTASGLGVASREYVRALKRQGVKVTVQGKRSRPPKKGGHRLVLLYHFTPNTIILRKERKHFNHIILNTVWETTKIPNQWRGNMNRFDAVFVPSLQNKTAMRRSGVKVPIFIVPHGINTKTFTPHNPKFRLSAAKGKFVFVSIFSFQHRKNPEGLLRAYWEEFSSADNVLLVIKTNGFASYENQQWILNRIMAYKRRLGIRKKTAPIVLIARHLNNKQQKGIYTLGHAFVLPTRGEGVGLPFLESLASGIPVITTGWGGHMDFLTNRNSFFVRFNMRNPAASMNRSSSISRQFRYLFAQKGQRWAEPDNGSLKRQMRYAFNNRSLCAQKGRHGRGDALHHSWNRSGALMKQAIEKVIRHKK